MRSFSCSRSGLMSNVPGAGASTKEISHFSPSDGRRRVVLVGMYLMPFAGIAFIWFIVGLRMWISGSVRRENVLLADIQLVSGILFVALFFVAAAASSVLAASVEFSSSPIDIAFARNLPQYGRSLLFVFDMRMAAMFVFTSSRIGRSAGVLPNWFTLGGFAVAAFLLLSATFSSWLVLVFPGWMLLLSGLLLDRARRIPADAVLERRFGRGPR
jgi:hypothetical protein